MANLQVFAPTDDYQFLPDLLRLDSPGDITTKSSTQFIYTNDRGDTVTVEGTGFNFNGNKATSGNITTVTVTNSGADVLFSITDVNQALKAFTQQLVVKEDSYLAMRVLLLGKDTITGSEESDTLGVPSPDDDTVRGLGADDFIMGDRGADTYVGGTGWDMLSYNITMYVDDGTQGIVLNAGKGVVTDPWGEKDKFSGFEGYRGSRYNDRMIGSGRDEDFQGLKGNDFFDGKGGWDVVDYTRDSDFPKDIGGFKGIKVDLSKDKGQVTDGFGDKDTLKNIESIRGTKFKDIFQGAGRNDQFEGLAGVDSFDGGGGFNLIAFHSNNWNNGKRGVIVDVSKGKILDDGFGNKESFANIDSFIGTRFGDKFIGDDGFNEFKGEGGNDIMTGKGGGDTFVFNPPPDTKKNHDIITDFNQKQGDHMALYTRDGFPELDDSDGSLNKSEFVANKGGNPTNANHRVAYDTETGKLWWVPQGNQGDERALIVTLKDAPKITHEAFEVWV